jgi:hypothetical protein
VSIARRIALVLAPLALAACAPVYDQGYGDAYGYGYPYGAYGGAVRDHLHPGYPYLGTYGAGVYSDGRTFRSAAERDAYLRAVAAARREALRDAEIWRQQDRYRRAHRDSDWSDRDVDWAERERRQAEWRDRRPVGSGPFDRAAAERRDALYDERRARFDHENALRRSERERARLDRLSRSDRIQDRIDRLDRMQRRHEARGAATPLREEAQVRQLRSERGVSESRENFENRARRAIEQSRETGVPVGAFMREEN